MGSELESKLKRHLTYNLYPAAHRSWVAVAVRLVREAQGLEGAELEAWKEKICRGDKTNGDVCDDLHLWELIREE